MRHLPTTVIALTLVLAATGSASADLAGAKKLNTAGMKAYTQHNWDDAKARFQEAIQADGDFVLPHYNLASVLALQGEEAGALAELDWLTKSPDPEAKKKLTKALKDPDFDLISTWADFRSKVGAASWDGLDTMARLTERNAAWGTEGNFCGGPWILLTIKGTKATYKTFWGCDATTTKTSDSGVVAAAGGAVTITWKAHKGAVVTGTSTVALVACSDHAELTCLTLEGGDGQQLSRGRVDITFDVKLK